VGRELHIGRYVKLGDDRDDGLKLLRDGQTGSGGQPAMMRTHPRACAMLSTPGNSRRNSTTADNSPRCSNTVRIMAACASLTQNIAGACEHELLPGKRRLRDQNRSCRTLCECAGARG
jgi:hypothetical protein